MELGSLRLIEKIDMSVERKWIKVLESPYVTHSFVGGGAASEPFVIQQNRNKFKHMFSTLHLISKTDAMTMLLNKSLF